MRAVVADLHSHTHYSDGVLSPADLVRRMAEGGIEVLAVTDHDTIDGLEEAAAAAFDAGIELVTGVELTVTVGEDTVHLLGYGFDPAHGGLRDYLRSFSAARRQRMEQMVAALRVAGVDVEMEDVEAQAAHTSAMGRPHLAQALVDAGYVDAVNDAFEEYIGNGQVGFVPAPGRPAEVGVRTVHEAGGVVSIAHPGQWMSSTLLRRLVRRGVDAIECRCPSHAPYLADYYRTRCQTRGLGVTGGSDYHGTEAHHEERIGAIGLSEIEWERLHALM
jgi:hypothetical protein